MNDKRDPELCAIIHGMLSLSMSLFMPTNQNAYTCTCSYNSPNVCFFPASQIVNLAFKLALREKLNKINKSVNDLGRRKKANSRRVL